MYKAFRNSSDLYNFLVLLRLQTNFSSAAKYAVSQVPRPFKMLFESSTNPPLHAFSVFMIGVYGKYWTWRFDHNIWKMSRESWTRDFSSIGPEAIVYYECTLSCTRAGFIAPRSLYTKYKLSANIEEKLCAEKYFVKKSYDWW